MAIANPFQLGRVTDLSAKINIIPNQWGIINSMGLFSNEMKSQKTVMIPRETMTDVVLTDKNWDERNNVITGGSRDVISFVIPHFPADESITPNDVDGNVNWDSLLQGGNDVMTLDQVRAKKMERLRRAHALTLERARIQLLKNGTVYAPNGTVVTNFYTEFSVSRKTINFNLASTTDNPLSKVEDVFAEIQDKISNGDIISNIVALCSPEFFSALIQNSFVYESYQYFSQSQGTQVLNGRLGMAGDARMRSFTYGGVTFIEARGTVAGEKYVEAGKAYAFPLGTDSFRTFFAPANRFDTVNSPAMESYYFERIGDWNDKIEVMSETNFMNALLRPQTVVTLDKDPA